MFTFNNTHKMAQQAIRQFLDKEIRPHVIHHENNPDDPLPGLAESVGYVKGVLAAI